MDDYAVLIPSYRRAEKQSTLDLIGGAFPASRIIIGTQCQADYRAYSERYGKRAAVVYKEGDSVGHNRNTLLEYCCKEGITKAVMLDDDIKLFKLYDKTKVRTPRKCEDTIGLLYGCSRKA